MLGDIHELADNLWMIEGEMPEDNEKYPDVANSVLYRVKDRLYLIDTGCGIKIRKSIEKLLNEVGPIRVFTLLNSHVHPDHVANNDLIEIVEAEEKHHYISEVGLPMLDFKRYFSDLFYEMSEYFDFLAGFKAHKFYYSFIRRIRGFLKIFMGEKKALRKLIPIGLKKWEPVNHSQNTIEFYEKLSKQDIPIGDVMWTGWIIGNDDVMILEERGHSPDQVIFFIPEHELIVAADASDEYFPLWPDSNGCLQKEAILKMIKMAKAGVIKLLVDGHHHSVMRGSNHIASFLQEFVDLQQGLTDVLIEILEREEGLNVKKIYKCLQDYAHIPAVKHYLDMEYPASPLSLHQTIALYLVDLGYRTMGKWRNKKFFKPISK